MRSLLERACVWRVFDLRSIYSLHLPPLPPIPLTAGGGMIHAPGAPALTRKLIEIENGRETHRTGLESCPIYRQAKFEFFFRNHIWRPVLANN